ncbi:MAG: hypothetical protein JO257_25890, partial [Deltaproteobacteria bacterium]|nr:hypothetical protein [Deltaproteobacteria bacterium]
MAESAAQDFSRVVVVIGEDVAAAAQLVRGIAPDAAIALVFAMASDGALVAALETAATLPVQLIKGAAPLLRGRIYVVPAAHDAIVEGGELIVEPTSGRGRNDRMLRTLADDMGRRAAAVVLRGHDGDGVLGVKRMRET